MLIDIGSGCQSATFTLNDDTTTSRAWDIKITQFACGDIDSGGPPGCLQYYKETYGIMQRFVGILQSLHTGIKVCESLCGCYRAGLGFSRTRMMSDWRNFTKKWEMKM